jgi:anti-sigma factor RsiW
MKPFEEQFTAWIDGQLAGEELADFEKMLAKEHPEALAEKQEALKLGDLLRAHPCAPRLSNPDFFNHQLLQRISAETPRPVEKKRSWFWSLPRLAWAGAVCLGLATFLAVELVPKPGQPVAEKSKYFAQVVEAWPADPSISATTVYNAQDNVTVLWLDGLDYIPATYALK